MTNQRTLLWIIYENTSVNFTWFCVAKVTIWSVTKAMLKEWTICTTKIATRRKHNLTKTAILFKITTWQITPRGFIAPD